LSLIPSGSGAGAAAAVGDPAEPETALDGDIRAVVTAKVKMKAMTVMSTVGRRCDLDTGISLVSEFGEVHGCRRAYFPVDPGNNLA
jgi:hypothetical protein